MSHIPNSAVPHAKAHDAHDAPETPATDQTPAKQGDAAPSGIAADAAGLGREALAVVKAHPKTAIAIGATIVAGAVAAVAAPLLAKRDDAPPKRARAKKPKSA